jgi:hypothetical protein
VYAKASSGERRDKNEETLGIDGSRDIEKSSDTCEEICTIQQRQAYARGLLTDPRA